MFTNLDISDSMFLSPSNNASHSYSQCESPPQYLSSFRTSDKTTMGIKTAFAGAAGPSWGLITDDYKMNQFDYQQMCPYVPELLWQILK